VKVASTKLTNSEWEKLQNKCNQQGLSIAEHIRNLVRVDLGGEVSSPPEENTTPQPSESNNNGKIGLTSIFGKKHRTTIPR